MRMVDQKPYNGTWNNLIIKSEAIDTHQSVALMVAKVTIDTDRWKVRNGNVF